MDDGVTYVDQTLTVPGGTEAWVPASCPTDTQIITGFVLPGRRAGGYYSLGSDSVAPKKKNAWLVRMGSDGPEDGSMDVRVVCLS